MTIRETPSIIKHKFSDWNNLICLQDALIKRGGGTSPMKPGNPSHPDRKVPILAEPQRLLRDKRRVCFVYEQNLFSDWEEVF
ncbi:hypothetical protein JOD24_000297 [Kroppenstedtia sanguinis]